MDVGQRFAAAALKGGCCFTRCRRGSFVCVVPVASAVVLIIAFLETCKLLSLRAAITREQGDSVN